MRNFQPKFSNWWRRHLLLNRPRVIVTALMISQPWFRLWLCAVRQQALTWANVDSDSSHHTALPGHNASNIASLTSDLSLPDQYLNFAISAMFFSPVHFCVSFRRQTTSSRPSMRCKMAASVIRPKCRNEVRYIQCNRYISCVCAEVLPSV